MKYQFCKVAHNPPETYADCVRACVASVLNLAVEDVPHFFHDGCDGVTGSARITEWALTRQVVPVFLGFPGELGLDEFLEAWGTANPAVPAILIGQTKNDGNHAVCLQGGTVEHNPSWTDSKIIKPADDGNWHIMIFSVV